jgi:2,4-dienoyl-CoA reductase-like NADH-dependent reductase (Old Yellow Enzyme family)
MKDQPKMIPAERIDLLEIARFALADADICDMMANHLDLSDNEMIKLVESINAETKGGEE